MPNATRRAVEVYKLLQPVKPGRNREFDTPSWWAAPEYLWIELGWSNWLEPLDMWQIEPNERNVESITDDSVILAPKSYADYDGTISVRYSVYNVQPKMAGATINEIRRQYQSIWNLPTDTKAYVGKDVVKESYMTRPGDIIEFHRPPTRYWLGAV